MYDYGSLALPSTGSGKDFTRVLDAAIEAAKQNPKRPLEDVLGNPVLAPVGPFKVGVVTVTPPMAAELLLKHNVHNRKISPAHGKRIASDMSADYWRLTHQGGAFTSQGDIGDIQHRLVGVAMSGKSVQMVIFIGLDNDLFKFVDSGRSRSIGATLSLAGHNGSGPLIGAIVKGLAIPYDEETIAFWDMDKRHVSNAEAVEYVEDNLGLMDAAHTVLETHDAAVDAFGDKAAAVFVYWRIVEAWGQDVADDFFALFGNDDLSDRSPTVVLTGRIDRHKSGKIAAKHDPKRKNILKREQIVWLAATAFRAWRANRQSINNIMPRADDEFPRFEKSVAPVDEAA